MKSCPTCNQEFHDNTEYCPNDGMKLRVQRKESIDPLLGVTLDRRWIIEKKIGEGGMGTVYLGHQKSVDRKVAIKTLKAQLSETDEFADRFFREAKMATKINHPHCVTVLDFGQSDTGILYLAMEYLKGSPLTQKIENKTLSFDNVFQIAIQISSALSAAHHQKIVHRDLKPDNIYVLDMPNDEIFIKVLDFGIAKALDSNTQITKAGMIFGTPEYMSPEQCRSIDIDGRSDLYGLGCILYEMLGGRPPFAAKTPMAVLLSHVNDEVAPIDSIASAHIPTNLSNIVMKLLEKDPDDRFPDARTLQKVFEKELNAYQNGKDSTYGKVKTPFTTQATAEMKMFEKSEEDLSNSFSNPIDELITLAGDRSLDLKPKRSKLPYIFVLFVLLAGAYGVYYLSELPVEDYSDSKAPPFEVKIEPSIVQDNASKPDLQIQPQQHEKVEERENAIENMPLKYSEKISKEEIKTEKLRKKTRKKARYYKRKAIHGKPNRSKKSKPHPDGKAAPLRKPRKAQPDPHPDLIKTEKGSKKFRQKIKKKIKREVKSNNKLNDALNGLLE